MRKRQHHFVPQFYLRQFSADGRSISLFNFRRGVLIERASIRKQCARRDYYGFAEGAEDSLAELEGEAAKIIREIRYSRKLPGPGTTDWQNLLGFVAIQKARTTRAGNSSNHVTDYLAKLSLQGQPIAESVDLEKYVIGHKHPTQVPLSVVGDVVEVAGSLAAHLVVNESPVAFMTSDDPVVVHNQYCEEIRHRGVKGWGCSGVQVFFPLSPRKLLLLFDATVYKVGRSHRGETVTRLSRTDDVEQINSLQMLNAEENGYIPPSPDSATTLALCRRLAPRRPTTRVRFVETKSVRSADGKTSSLIHHYEPLLPIRMTLSFIRVRTKALEFPRVREECAEGGYLATKAALVHRRSQKMCFGTL